MSHRRKRARAEQSLTRARSSPPKRVAPRDWRHVIAVALACIMYFAMAMHGVAHKSGTYDEYIHVTAGYAYWKYDDFRLNPEQGNWPQRLVALPQLSSSTDLRALDPAAWERSDMWSLSDRFFFSRGRDADAMLWRSRAVTAVLAALLGALVFAWSRALFGIVGGYVSLAVYVFSPTILAHGALATSDLIAAGFFTAATWALWRVLHDVTLRKLALSILATGGLLLSKASGPIFLLIALPMVAVRLIDGRPLILRLRGDGREITERGRMATIFAAITVAHILGALLLIWASYDFRYEAFEPATAAGAQFFDTWNSLLADASFATGLVQWGRDTHILPEAYLYGLTTIAAFARGRVSFLNGHVTMNGSRAFFPYAALVKTTLPGLILVAAIPFLVVWRHRRRRASDTLDDDRWFGIYDLAPLLLLIVVYGGSALLNTLNIGYRHLLPIIPAVIVLTGIAGQIVAEETNLVAASNGFVAALRASWAQNRRAAIGAGALALLLLWHAGESLAISPNYLAYFNEIDGGPSRAYQHLVDSSLDWGQDLPGLADWLRNEGLQGANHPPVYLSYFGTAIPFHYGIDAEPLAGFPDRWQPHEPEPLRAGIYAFSATMLQGVYFMAPGAWSAQYEASYRAMQTEVKEFAATAADTSARRALVLRKGVDTWLKTLHVFEHLRTARLAAYLRKRAPDAEIGYSILVYRVTDADLARALDGPSP